jgi:hypothetical protein
VGKSGFPQFDFVTVGVHEVDEFAVVVSGDVVEDGDAVFPEFIDQRFDVLDAVVNHELLTGRGIEAVSSSERTPLQHRYLIETHKVCGFKTYFTPCIDVEPKIFGVPRSGFLRIVMKKVNTANAVYFRGYVVF